MFAARLVCSDPGCAAELDAEASDPLELETLICDCGCALEVIAWPDWLEEPGELLMLHARVRVRVERRAA